MFVPSDQLDSYWLTEKKVAPRFPGRSSIKHPEACVAVVFIIEADGTTTNHRVVVAYPSTYYNQSAIKAAKQFLFKPSENNPDREPVFTTNSFTFQIIKSRRGKNQFDDAGQKRLSAICTDAANKILTADVSKAVAE